MLGRYENFPQIIHGVARFNCKPPMRKVQLTIVRSLHELNEMVYDLSDITPHFPSKCEVSFELGVAEEVGFNYLDKEELDRFQRSIIEREATALDFFCVIRYHVVNERGKRVPLKFDYHLLRFMFIENGVELRVCHERGTQRVPLEDLVTFITNRINEELSKKRLKPLDLEYLRTL